MADSIWVLQTIFYEEDLRRFNHQSPPSPGNFTQNVLPSPAADSTETRLKEWLIQERQKKRLQREILNPLEAFIWAPSGNFFS
jgi:hypothetical protein